MVLKNLRFADWIILLITAVLTIFLTVRIYGAAADTLHFIINGNRESWIYSVDQNARVTVPGPLGNTVIELEDGKAQVVSSPCANQICVASGIIQRKAQWIACLPNAVLIRVEGSGGQRVEAEIDAVVW